MKETDRKLLEENARRQQEAKIGKGLMLAKTKYSSYCEGLSDYQASTCALLMENMSEWFNSFSESTRMTAIGDFEKFAFPIVRALMPNLAAQDLVTIQTMDGPVSLVFYLDFVYGTSKGSVSAGSKLFETPNRYYSSPTVDNEEKATGNGSTKAYNFFLSHIPVVPGSVTITDGAQIVTDDGDGHMIGDITSDTNTIDYTTGEVTFSFTNNVVNLVKIYATYDYDMEMNEDIPEVDLLLTSAPVTAIPRKMRTRWSIEAAYNLQKLHGLVAEVELLAAMTHEVKYEIDGDIVAQLLSISMDGPGTYGLSRFDRTPPTGVSWRDHKEALVDSFIETSALIYQQSGRGTGNWIVGGVEVTNIIESLTPRFIREANIRYVRGVHKFGTLDATWDVYKDPAFPSKQFLVGYKGPSMLETGYVYAPYLPLYTTDTIVLDDFKARKGLATMAGKKVVNSKFYARNEIVRS